MFAFKLASSVLVFVAVLGMVGCAGVVGGSLPGSPGAAALLETTPVAIDFGDIATGTTAKQSVSVFNSGPSSVKITAVTAQGTGFSVTAGSLPVSVASGASAHLVVEFSPKADGKVQGQLSIESNAHNSIIVMGLQGTGASKLLDVTPSSAQFGNVPVGTDMSQTIRVRAAAGEVVIDRVTVGGSWFSFSGPHMPVKLSQGQSISLTAAFRPNTVGGASGSIAVESDATDSPLRVPLTGAGVKAMVKLSATPASLSFGSVKDGTTETKTVTLKSTGNANADISHISISGSAFKVSGAGTGTILKPGQTLDLAVTFRPSQSGNIGGTLDIASDALNSPLRVPLAGSGTTSQTVHSVDLRWSASTSSSVVGYNVYRGGKAAGPYAKLNGTVDSSTSYRDTSVSSGHTYYYVVASVSSKGIQSTFSSAVAVTIP